MSNKERFEAGLTFTLKGESINTLHKLNKSHGSSADDWFISGKHRYMEESEWTHECNVNIKAHVIECFAVFMNTLARSVIRYEHLIFEEEKVKEEKQEYTIDDFKKDIEEKLIPSLNAEFNTSLKATFITGKEANHDK